MIPKTYSEDGVSDFTSLIWNGMGVSQQNEREMSDENK